MPRLVGRTLQHSADGRELNLRILVSYFFSHPTNLLPFPPFFCLPFIPPCSALLCISTTALLHSFALYHLLFIGLSATLNDPVPSIAVSFSCLSTHSRPVQPQHTTRATDRCPSRPTIVPTSPCLPPPSPPRSATVLRIL